MSYNPENQYRASITRGRTKTNMDNLLPFYAHTLNGICPCSKEIFRNGFDEKLKQILHISSKKTLDNHRTEIAGKLFGMYYEDKHGIKQLSERTAKLLKDNDQPAFFKDICIKFQFPNGMQKINYVKAHLEAGLNIRQCLYILELLIRATKRNIILTMDEIGYYVLNSLDALKGEVLPDQILQTIDQRRKSGILKKVQVNGKASSFATQHIRETMNYLELANLILIHDKEIYLNPNESKSISHIASFWNKPLPFDVSKYNLESSEGKRDMYRDWDEYYSKLSEPDPKKLDTSVPVLTGKKSKEIFGIPIPGEPPVELGKEGEAYVYKIEKERVETFNPRLKNKVLNLAHIKGMGYDIQSVHAEPGPKAEHKIFIEVKSTKRVTVPSKDLVDTITLTGNEWIAAEQYGDDFKIFRVYFTPEKIVILSITDPFAKSKKGIIDVTPMTYVVNFTEKAGDFL